MGNRLGKAVEWMAYFDGSVEWMAYFDEVNDEAEEAAHLGFPPRMGTDFI